MNILVVDDEKGIRNVIKEYLISDNFNVLEAENGIEAINVIKTNHIDLLILDIMMPEMDGYSALKIIKTIKNIPTIVLSARSDEYDKLTGFDLGIDDYVTKPFSPKELIARVKALLKRSNLSDSYSYETLSIDYKAHSVIIDNKELNISPK